MPQLWDKQSSVYLRMCSDETFETYLFIVPAYDLIHSKIDEYGQEKEYFIRQCQKGTYILSKQGKEWIDIEKYGLDYLFYQRPYDPYLPDSLKSTTTVRFTKICYIPYATPEIKNTGIYPRYFFRNLYLGFMENRDGAEKNIETYRKNCGRNIQHFLNIGYPVFERCINHREECKYKRYLWTPRWTYDPIVGGSHFMEYYSQLTDFEWNDATLMVRPHPMMWDNFIKTKLINGADKTKILAEWDKRHIEVDRNESIEETFFKTDIMISDRSSVIPMFFLTGKPIIYCPFESMEYGGLFNSIYPGLYIANNWSELENHIRMLMNKKDPLLSIRKQIITDKFSCNYSATDNIVQTIKKDFYNQSIR